MHRLVRLSVAISLATTMTFQAAAETLNVSVRAFIPNAVSDNPGYVKIIKDASGKQVAVIASPNPLENVCYLTDQRTFSTDENASARVAMVAAFNVLGSGGASLITDLSDTGTTHAISCDTGSAYCTDKASKTELKWDAPIVTGLVTKFPFSARAANPCIKPDGLAPKIFMNGAVTLNSATGDVSISGSGSKFPSLEAFVTFEANKPASLITLEATGSVLNIPFSRELKGSSLIPIFDGTWKSDDPSNRFTLLIDGRNARFVERAAAGSTLERQLKLQPDKGGLLTGYRANDSETLEFLGFSPQIIPTILSYNPQPSYFTIERRDGAIKLVWAGLLVTKDAKGNVKEVKQPGTGPIKTFTLKR
jgi:hypothetical protein